MKSDELPEDPRCPSCLEQAAQNYENCGTPGDVGIREITFDLEEKKTFLRCPECGTQEEITC